MLVGNFLGFGGTTGGPFLHLETSDWDLSDLWRFPSVGPSTGAEWRFSESIV